MTAFNDVFLKSARNSISYRVTVKEVYVAGVLKMCLFLMLICTYALKVTTNVLLKFPL